MDDEDTTTSRSRRSNRKYLVRIIRRHEKNDV